MGQYENFVIVHLGAGYHSFEKEKMYKNLIIKCCQETLKDLESSDGSIVSALVKGIRLLEDSGIVNAGKGSNKTCAGLIEGDSSIMVLGPNQLACVSAIQNCVNPILVAESLLNNLIKSGQPSKVVTGESQFHEGEKILDPISDTLICSDTVGIICIKHDGQVGMACSSGGPEGKISGRIGPCALPGVGFWGEKKSEYNHTCLFTGVGEQIIIQGGARTVHEYIIYHSDRIDLNDFLDELYFPNRDEKSYEFGFISVMNKTLNNSNSIEIIASHSTPSFIFGWQSSINDSPIIHISRKNTKKYKCFAKYFSIKKNSTF